MQMYKILIFVSGLSPAIISETLYALQQGSAPWAPDKIIIYTTTSGKQKIIDQLINSGVFASLCVELKLTIDLLPEDIKIVTVGANYLNDIRNNQENTYFADFISSQLFELCKNLDNQLYVSLAGGRKTMGYYLGYALSLFGRQQDKLMHVLVNEPFDSIPDFFYPSQSPATYFLANGQVINSATAVIDLAEIPFVRMRYTVPEALLSGKISFSQAVSFLQAKLSRHDFNLVIDLDSNLVYCSDVVIKLTASQIGIYAFLAQIKQQSESYCSINKFADDYQHIIELVRKASKGVLTGRVEQLKLSLQGTDFANKIYEYISKINNIFRESLGSDASYYMIDAIRSGHGNSKIYGVKPAPQNITIL